MSKKKQIASLSSKLGITSLLIRCRSLFNTHVRILGYHRVVDPERAYDTANVSATPEAFNAQLRYYKSNYDMLTFAELCAIVEDRLSCPKRPLLLSFDDGFADNYEFAFPLLKEHGVSAAFFISTSYIDTSHLFWFDKVGYLIKNTDSESFSLSTGEHFSIQGIERQKTIKQLLLALKKLPDEQRQKEMIHLENNLHIPSDVGLDPINLPMTWAQVSEMHHAGMEILSHTHRHSILSRLATKEDIVDEVITAKSIIEEKLSAPCPVIAYPVGKFSSYDQRVVKAVGEVGYKLACTYESGLNAYPLAERFELRRIHVNHDYSLNTLASMIAFPEIFAF